MTNINLHPYMCNSVKAVPRLVIAGTNSGCGKTTLTSGILAALAGRGLSVQPFKVGPDYIDPMFHTFITRIPSRNLDSWLLDRDMLNRLFFTNASEADIAVIEGVMGFYDGLGGASTQGSTSEVAAIIKAPVALVVNADGMSLSAAAIVKGFKDFGKDQDGFSGIKCVIFNNVSSESHYLLLKESVERWTGVKAAGYLPALPEISLESRHLGLVPSGEVEGLRQKVSRLAEQVERTVDLDCLLDIARGACPREAGAGKRGGGVRPEGRAPGSGAPGAGAAAPAEIRIAVARDRAFNFYYADNLDLLEQLGAELVFFSPLEDERLPAGISGLYIGGGYPEVFAEKLSRNKAVMREIKGAIASGMPAYAECGGLMYLSRSLATFDGNRYEMAGVIPGDSRMTQSLQRFGYVELEAVSDNVLSGVGDRIRAHEFHYSDIAVDSGITRCFKAAKRGKGGEAVWNCGYRVNNLLAAYPHIHFLSNTAFAGRFVDNCRKYKAHTGPTVLNGGNAL